MSAPGSGGEESLDDAGEDGRGVSRHLGAGDGEEEEGLDTGGKKGASQAIFSNLEMDGELGSNQTSHQRVEGVSITRKSRDGYHDGYLLLFCSG